MRRYKLQAVILLLSCCTPASAADAWTPNAWAVLSLVLVILIFILISAGYLIYKRLKVSINTLQNEFRTQKQTSDTVPAPEELSETLLPEVAQPQEEVLTEGNKQHTLLIIEDHLEIRLYLKLIFSNEYELLMAENGEEGLKIAGESLPDLIITDVMMPVMDGFECCKLLKEGLDTCHIPVILLTALTEDENVMKGIELGADDYIQKPFNPNILRTKIKRLIKSRQELKEIYTRLLTPATGNLGTGDKIHDKSLKFPEDPFIMEIVRIINDNMKNPDFNVKKLADIMNISQPTLYRRVKMITNFTISELIRGIRLKRAAELLRTRRHNVQEISEIVGYSDLGTFRKNFVEFYGTTPSTFSNKMLEDMSN